MIKSVSYPNQTRNYCVFDESRIEKKKDLCIIKKTLENPKSEDEVLESLYALNLMLDDGVKGVEELYPVLSKYNTTKSPNIQTFLAGIYRKTQVPDAFGPLVKMLIQNSLNPRPNDVFDPNEEIGGAILSYVSDRFRK